MTLTFFGVLATHSYVAVAVVVVVDVDVVVGMLKRYYFWLCDCAAASYKNQLEESMDSIISKFTYFNKDS